MTWFSRRTRKRLAAHLAEDEPVFCTTECAPLGAETAADDTQRTAVLTDRSLYYVVGGDKQVVTLPFARMHQLNRRGLALLFFRIDDAQVTWELRSTTFATRAERQFRQHGQAAHREWVSGREPAGFMFRAHHDLLTRLAGGASLHNAVTAQHVYVSDAVYGDTQDRAHSRAAVRRLKKVHELISNELQQLHDAMPTASLSQHAMALAARPAPWPEDAVAIDDGSLPDDTAAPGVDYGAAPWSGTGSGTGSGSGSTGSGSTEDDPARDAGARVG